MPASKSFVDDSSLSLSVSKTYLALVPRGLQQIISNILLQQTNNACQIASIGNRRENEEMGMKAQQALREQQQKRLDQAASNPKKIKKANRVALMDSWCQHE